MGSVGGECAGNGWVVCRGVCVECVGECMGECVGECGKYVGVCVDCEQNVCVYECVECAVMYAQ